MTFVDKLYEVSFTFVFCDKGLYVIIKLRDFVLEPNLLFCQDSNLIFEENCLIPYWIILIHHVPDLKRDQLLDFIILFDYIVAGYLKSIVFCPLHFNEVSLAKFVESFSEEALVLLKHGL